MDVYACLEYCLSRGLASKDHTLGRCVASLNDLGGVEPAADLFRQHTAVALKTAPAPVLELDFFNGPHRHHAQMQAGGCMPGRHAQMHNYGKITDAIMAIYHVACTLTSNNTMTPCPCYTCTCTCHMHMQLYM